MFEAFLCVVHECLFYILRDGYAFLETGMAFRIEDMEVAVHTNNGVERQNEALKYEYLVGYRNFSLSEMLSMVIENFLPNSYLK